MHVYPDHTAKLLRAIRKYNGINQVNMAKYLNVAQGTISKIESGNLSMDGIQWISFCQAFKLDPMVITTGRIEALDDIKITLRNKSVPGNFKVPRKYSIFMTSTVRTVYPFVKFMERKIGVEKTIEFFKSQKMDHDYFTIQNLPINLRVIEDIVTYLVSRGIITSKNVGDILTTVPASEVHEYALSQINPNLTPDKNFKRFVKSINELYEKNSLYTYEGDDGCFVKVRDERHVNELGLSQDFMQFRELYNLEHFNRVAPLFSVDKTFQVINQDGGWDIAVS